MNQIKPEEWFSKAEEDWLTAKILLSVPESPNRSIAFSSQQAVEKYLKAFLSSIPDLSIPKTHDIGLLIKMCSDNKLDLSDIDLNKLAGLSYFAVEARYPGDADIVSKEEALESFQLSSKIREIIKIALNNIK